MLKLRKIHASVGQDGFGIIWAIMLIIVTAATVFGTYRVHESAQTKSSEKTLVDHGVDSSVGGAETAYTFIYSKADTANWIEHEPFLGFTMKIPGNWAKVRDSDFGRSIVSGTINRDGTSSTEYGPTQKSTEIESPGIRRDKHNTVTNGAVIKIYMTVQESDEARQKDPCEPIYKNRPQELISSERFIVCQTKVSEYSYDFDVRSARIHYQVTTIYNPAYTDEQKNEFNSIALDIVKSFNLY